jgi:hypothetical protein
MHCCLHQSTNTVELARLVTSNAVLVVLPELVHAPPNELQEEVIAPGLRHFLVQLVHETGLVRGLDPGQEVGRGGVPVVPVPAASSGRPPGGREAGSEADPVRHALNNAREVRVRPVAPVVVLPHVGGLVVQHARDLVYQGGRVGWLARDVLRREVDRGAPRGRHSPGHALHDQSHSRNRLGRAQRKRPLNKPSRVRQHLAHVLNSELVVEPLPSGRVWNVVAHLERRSSSSCCLVDSCHQQHQYTKDLGSPHFCHTKESALDTRQSIFRV